MTDAPFATITDLKDRWRTFPTGNETYATTLLGDASQFILDEAPRAASEVNPETLRRITCSLVRRSMEAEEEAGFGLEQVQDTAGPFSRSTRAVSPYGDFILSPRERRQLGITKQRAFSVDLLAGSRAAHRSER
jgi:hypothetical protein